MLFLAYLRSSLMAAGACLACFRGEYLLGAVFAVAFAAQLVLWGRGIRSRSEEPTGELATSDEAPAAQQPAALDLATLGHELKTPVVGVLGLARILKTTELDNEQRELAEGIIRSSENLGGLLDTLLESARNQAAEVHPPIRLERESVDLLELRDDLMGPMRAAVEGSAVQLQSEVRLGGYRFLMGDQVRLQQIGRNLLGNALKFTERGEVVLRLTVLPGPSGPRLLLSVADTGTGIAPERLSAVLDRFEQEHPGIQGRFGGSGLGLSIVKDLTDAMGGELKVTSTVGLGTTVTAAIPMGLTDESNRLRQTPSPRGNRPAMA